MRRLKNVFFKNFTSGACKYYLYRHIRLDLNIPFYVGIGTNNNNYHRAKMIQTRNQFWNAIKSKTEIRVEIIFESNSEKEIKNKEIEFIKLYGRRDINLGTLVNFTNGGDGQNGKVQSYETINKRVVKMSKKVYQYSLDGNFIKEWESATIAGNYLNISKSLICSCCSKKYNKAGNFIWSYNFEKVEPYKRNTLVITEEYLKKLSDVKLRKLPTNLETMRKSRWKEIVEYENNIEIKRYCSSFEAERQLGLKPKVMNTYLKGKRKKIKNYEHKTWKYA